ncbi:MAG: hypothetical protein AB8B91_17945 [Rubripirellula sp.]
MMELYLDAQTLFSGLSLLVTCYFWLTRVRKERPHLQFHQLSDFRAVCRRIPDDPDRKRLCFQQLDSGGVLIVNHSIRQNSIVLFECFLTTDDGVIEGDWGYGGDDKPPWNIGPETSIPFSPACFFDVPADYQIPERPSFYLRFVTASGKRFTHRFTQQAKQHRAVAPLSLRDAA